MSNSKAMGGPLRVLICGAGNRAFPKDPPTSLFRGWFETIQNSPDCTVVGVQDVAAASLERVTRNYPLDGIPTFSDLERALDAVPCDAVLICPSAEAHAAAALAAIGAGRHVLIEKPMVVQLADAFRIQHAAEERALVVSVVQNWRLKSVGSAFREAVRSGRIGRVGDIFFRYVRDRERPHLPDYLFEEPYPLLYAMSIHHFDLFRYALGENIESVEGRAFIPPWSRYRSPPFVHLWMRTGGGTVISYAGTFSSKNRHVPQESLVVDGSEGCLTNESQWCDPPLLFSSPDTDEPEDLTAGASRDVRDQYNQADDEYLRDFVEAIREGRPPLCPPADNIWTLATVDAAVRACESGSAVNVADVVAEAEDAATTASVSDRAPA
ncbi:MAG: Gfo/Idh/MocA family oxidoreductase [Gemmatimonadetes bacterium]|nr:Gfo/Idh/MocA family oxidoreductase [Gemmatimonadota bacterium]